MINPALSIVDAMNADETVFADLGGRIYAYRIPPEAQVPLALVMVPSSFPAARPTSQWWSYMVTIDIHSESPQTSLDISDKVMRLVPTVVGNTSGGVVADCQVESVTAITDGSWTPTRYRQIVTVELTAREP